MADSRKEKSAAGELQEEEVNLLDFTKSGFCINFLGRCKAALI
jgi:hypothetical protein